MYPPEAALESVCRSQPDGLRHRCLGARCRWYAAPIAKNPRLQRASAAPGAAASRSQRVEVPAARATELSRCITRFLESAMLADTGNRVSCPRAPSSTPGGREWDSYQNISSYKSTNWRMRDSKNTPQNTLTFQGLGLLRPLSRIQNQRADQFRRMSFPCQVSQRILSHFMGSVHAADIRRYPISIHHLDRSRPKSSQPFCLTPLFSIRRALHTVHSPD